MDTSVSNLRVALANLNSDAKRFISSNDSEVHSSALEHKINESNVLTQEIEDILSEISKYDALINEAQSEESSVLKENILIKSSLESNEKKLKKQLEDEQNAKEFDDIHARLREELKIKSELKLRCDQMEADFEHLKKLRNIYNKFSINESTPNENSIQMRLYYKNKLFEVLNGIKIEKVANTWQVIFNNLSEDFEGLNNSPKHKNKRRKMAQGASNFITSVVDANIILKNYERHLKETLVAQEVNEAGKKYGIDFDRETNVIMILSKKINAKIQIPMHYPFENTSKIKILALTGHNDAQIATLNVYKDFNSLLEWINNLMETMSYEKR